MPGKFKDEKMNLQDAADKEVEALEEQLDNGNITEEEFRRYTREIAEELRHEERRF